MPEPKFERVKQISVFEQALRQLRDAILNNQYHPGDKLPTVVELSEALYVSHVTIRQVLSVLEAQGLIESRRGSGVYVAPNHKWKLTQGSLVRRYAQRDESVIQMLEIRGAIEGMNASIVAKNASDELLAELDSIVKQQLAKSEANADVDELSEMDVRFHTTISLASGNTFAHEIVSHVAPAFADSKRDMLWSKPHLLDAIQDHIRILDAMKARDEMRAGQEMQAHLARVREVVRSYHMENDINSENQPEE